MTKKLPTISVVIPIYNDEQFIDDCLFAVQQQSSMPLEVIVVDNNCTDTSILLAKKYRNVTIIQENKQGLSFARNTGFAAAKGDIVLRIDADTILPKTYVETLQNIAVEHPNIAGFTGYGKSRYEFIPYISTPWSWMYFTYTHAIFGYPMLWGANMSVRKSEWNKLEKYLINSDTIHEDQDVSLALASVGGRIMISRRLATSVQMETILHFSKFHKYVLMMKCLKEQDATHERANLASRLRPTISWVRMIYWIFSAWSVYAFYAITIVYSGYFSVKKTLTTRLFLADRPQDS